MIDFAMSPSTRKKRGKKLIATQSALLRFADVGYFKMPGSNFKFINPVVRLVEDSFRARICFF